MIAILPIGTVRSTRDDLRDDHWGEVRQPRWPRELMAQYW